MVSTVRRLGERQGERYRMDQQVGRGPFVASNQIVPSNQKIENWSDSPFGSFQSAARLSKVELKLFAVEEHETLLGNS